MRELRIGVVGVIVLALSVVGSGDVIELPLNCAGTYDINTPAWTSDFDLGVTFSDISHVYITWSGEMTAGVDEWMGVQSPALVGFDAVFLHAYPNIQVASIRGGVSTYPAPEPFDVQTEFWIWPGDNWDNLLDGKDTVKIDFRSFAGMIPELHVVDSGSGMLNNATLVVEGTVIPEPATLLLFAAGLTGLLARNRTNLKK